MQAGLRPRRGAHRGRPRGGGRQQRPRSGAPRRRRARRAGAPCLQGLGGGLKASVIVGGENTALGDHPGSDPGKGLEPGRPPGAGARGGVGQAEGGAGERRPGAAGRGRRAGRQCSWRAPWLLRVQRCDVINRGGIKAHQGPRGVGATLLRPWARVRGSQRARGNATGKGRLWRAARLRVHTWAAGASEEGGGDALGRRLARLGRCAPASGSGGGSWLVAGGGSWVWVGGRGAWGGVFGVPLTLHFAHPGVWGAVSEEGAAGPYGIVVQLLPRPAARGPARPGRVRPSGGEGHRGKQYCFCASSSTLFVRGAPAARAAPCRLRAPPSCEPARAACDRHTRHQAPAQVRRRERGNRLGWELLAAKHLPPARARGHTRGSWLMLVDGSAAAPGRAPLAGRRRRGVADRGQNEHSALGHPAAGGKLLAH
jgi:hypothetical protein